MDHWVHDSVVDNAMVDPSGLLIRHCMVGHQSLSCPRRIHRYRLDLEEEILQEMEQEW